MKSGCQGREVRTKRSIKLPVLNNSTVRNSGIRQSKTSSWRAAVLIALNLIMIAHFIQWRITGQTISPIEPSETMQTIEKGAINAGFIFFALAILATLFFGRFVCGWGCHILAIQDFCAWMLKKVGLTPKPFRSRLLVFVPLIAALYMFVWPTAIRLFALPEGRGPDPSIYQPPRDQRFLGDLPFGGSCDSIPLYLRIYDRLFFGIQGLLHLRLPVRRFLQSCRQGCRRGRSASPTPATSAGIAPPTCTSNVLVHSEVKEYGMVIDPGCMKCMDCISVCPNDALYFGFAKPAIGVTEIDREKILPRRGLKRSPPLIVFLMSFLAVWDVYQLVPMLMALGIAAVTTFLALRAWRLFRSNDLSFYRFNLKSSGKIGNRDGHF